MTDHLKDLRTQLDDIDRRIVEALSERQHVVDEVAKLKAQEGTRLVRDRTREEELLGRLVGIARELGINPNFVTRVFREILDYSVRSQQAHLSAPVTEGNRNIVVAYQGSEGSYSQLAASRYFADHPRDVRYQGYDTFSQMLESVRSGVSDFAMLPIENTTAGSINEAYDLLAKMNLSIVGEEVQRVDHCLVAVQDVPVETIRRIFSHPQALAQCSIFLSTLRDCHVESFTDTAMAVEKIKAEQDPSQAAIASEEAARINGLPIIRRGIANQEKNFTRFVVVAAEPVRYDLRIPCKTSLLFATRHEDGALVSSLNILANHRLNLTKLESRPRLNSPWEYLFYVDFEGNLSEERVRSAIEELGSHVSFVKVLGSYPARTTREAGPADPRRPIQKNEAVAAQAPTPDAPLVTLFELPYRRASRAFRTRNTEIRVGSVVIGGEYPILIAGPALVKSREQLMACATALERIGVQMLKGDCFADGTVRNDFQGLGYEALDVLEEAAKTTLLPVMTSILDVGDLDKVTSKVDVLRITSKNMTNAALLTAVGHVDRPVVLDRNSVSSVDEWLVAAEQILVQGNQQVLLCERGVRTFESTGRPILDLAAIALIRERTHLPIIVDLSQVGLSPEWIPSIVDAALAMGAQGFVVDFQVGASGEYDLDEGALQRLVTRLEARAQARVG